MINAIDIYNAPLTDFIYPLVDCRSEADYELSHIPTSFCASKFETHEALHDAILDMGFENSNKIVLYGHTEDDPVLVQIKSYFMTLEKMSVSVLEGGFNVFMERFPGIVLSSFDSFNNILPAYIPIANVFLGSAISAKLPLLQALQVTAVVNAGSTSEYRKELDDSLHYLTLYMDDQPSQQLEPHLTQAVDFMIEHGKTGPVFVHCAQGISRSVTCVVALLMRQHGMKCSEAIDYVKECRPVARPNIGFVAQLKEMEEQDTSNK